MAGRNAPVRPPVDEDVLASVRKHCQAAVEKLAEWVKSDDPKTSLAAIATLLERGYGKPGAGVAADEEPHVPVTEIMRVIVGAKD
jgi:hypothetical protein